MRSDLTLLLVTMGAAAAALRTPPLAMRTVAALRTPAPAMMAEWKPADMAAKRQRIPEEVADLLTDFEMDVATTEQLWAALRSCFDSEDEAISAAMRNTGTILPYLNSPTNIYGSFEVLEEMLGTEAARDVCSKNPGILQCNPSTLARENPESIVSTANTVEKIEGVLGSIPPALRQNLDKVAFVLLALPIAKRLSDCAGATCGL